VRSTGMGLLLEEHRTEIGGAWRQAVERELGVREPALAFAVAPLLREMSLTLGSEGEARRSRDAWTRCAVLVRSSASAAQLAREFKLLHRCLWDALKARGAPIAQGERTAVDEWLDEALAEALERLERVRLRAASFEQQGPVIVPPVARQTRAPIPPRPTPPPLPRRGVPPQLRTVTPSDEPIIELEPIDPR
jgi:hypothetical protein